MIIDTTKYKWELCFTDGSNGHSLWFDQLGIRYSIKDQSGDTPDTTDDGVCWLGKGEAYVHTNPYGQKLLVSFTVKTREIHDQQCSCDFNFGIRVAKKIGMKIVLSETLKKLEPFLCTPNSTLTDAAPDLLNACVKMCEYGYLSNWPESMLKDGREAIGKARGLVK
jgi:hypothetical protein